MIKSLYILWILHKWQKGSEKNVVEITFRNKDIDIFVSSDNKGFYHVITKSKNLSIREVKSVLRNVG